MSVAVLDNVLLISHIIDILYDIKTPIYMDGQYCTISYIIPSLTSQDVGWTATIKRHGINMLTTDKNERINFYEFPVMDEEFWETINHMMK